MSRRMDEVPLVLDLAMVAGWATATFGLLRLGAWLRRGA